MVTSEETRSAGKNLEALMKGDSAKVEAGLSYITVHVLEKDNGELVDKPIKFNKDAKYTLQEPGVFYCDEPVTISLIGNTYHLVRDTEAVVADSDVSVYSSKKEALKVFNAQVLEDIGKVLGKMWDKAADKWERPGKIKTRILKLSKVSKSLSSRLYERWVKTPQTHDLPYNPVYKVLSEFIELFLSEYVKKSYDDNGKEAYELREEYVADNKSLALLKADAAHLVAMEEELKNPDVNQEYIRMLNYLCDRDLISGRDMDSNVLIAVKYLSELKPYIRGLRDVGLSWLTEARVEVDGIRTGIEAISSTIYDIEGLNRLADTLSESEKSESEDEPEVSLDRARSVYKLTEPMFRQNKYFIDNLPFEDIEDNLNQVMEQILTIGKVEAMQNHLTVEQKRFLSKLSGKTNGCLGAVQNCYE